jgi:ABC-type multidrug transport system fused ATPase/permease subunit
MSDIDAIERDVEQAREKFAGDLARLRSPDILARFKDDLWAAKDDLVERTTEAAKDGAQRVFDDLKDRATANPAAALAIGAGLAWQLARRPPIATLLVGLGVVSLLRTSPWQASAKRSAGGYDEFEAKLDRKNAARRDTLSHAQKFTRTARQKVREWSADAGDVVSESMTQLTDIAASAAERTSDVVQEARAMAHQTASEVAERAAAMTQRASNVASLNWKCATNFC